MQIKHKHHTKATVIFVSIVAALAGLLFGVDTGVINGSINLIQKDLHLTLGQAETVTSILSIGALIGALFSGFVTRTLGRKRALVISAALFSIFIIVAVSATSYHMLLIARFFLGIGIGLSSFVAPMYLGEMAPPRLRGGLLSLYQLMIVSGMFIIFITNDLLRTLGSWRLMFSVIFIPALLMLIGCLFLPKSPRWLVLKGRIEQAKHVLERIRSGEVAAIELNEIKAALSYRKELNHFHKLVLFKNKYFLKVLALGIFLQLLQQFCGVNAIGYYSTAIFTRAGLHNPYLMTIVMGAIKVLATVWAIVYVDKWGRKPILYMGLLIAIVSTLFLGAGFYGEQLGYHNHIVSMTILITSLTFQLGYSASLGPIVWMMCAEIFPLKSRDIGMTMTTATNWFGNAVLTRYILSAIVVIGAAYTFWIFCAICVIGIILIALYSPETKGVPLEEMEMNLKDGIRLKNIGRKKVKA